MENIVSLHILKPGLDVIFSQSKSDRFLLQGLLLAWEPASQDPDSLTACRPEPSSAPFQFHLEPGVLPSTPCSQDLTDHPLPTPVGAALSFCSERTLFCSPAHSQAHTHRTQAHVHTGACTCVHTCTDTGGGTCVHTCSHMDTLVLTPTQRHTLLGTCS